MTKRPARLNRIAGRVRSRQTPQAKASSQRRLLLVAGPAITCAVALVIIGHRWDAARSTTEDRRQPPETVGPTHPESVTRRPTQETTVPVAAEMPPLTVAALKAEEIATAEQLLRDYPDDPAVTYLVAHVYNNHGDRTKAVEYWRRTVALDPNNAPAYDAMGKVALLKEDYASAVELWQKTLQINPTMSGVHLQLARALMGAGETDQAIGALQKDIEITPDASWSYYLLGELYRQREQYEQAKRSFEAAVRIDPSSVKAHYGLATVCLALRQTDQAKQSMERFSRLKAEQVKLDKGLRSSYDDLEIIRTQAAKTYTEIGLIYAGRRNFSQAARLWHRASQLDGANVACRTNLATLYQQQGQPDQALAVCLQLTQIEPQNGAHWFNMGVLCAGLGRYEQAIEAIDKARAIAPRQSGSYRLLAQMYLETGRDIDEAAALAQQAVALEPIAENYFVLGAVRAKEGNLQGAASALQEAIKLDPANPKYRSTYEVFRKRLQQER